jgi:hypothetical protein
MTFNFLESIKIPNKNKANLQLISNHTNTDSLVD